MKERFGGTIIAQMLLNEGVDTVFGIPDGTYLRLISELRRLGIRLITPRHETSAVHMAGAYARLTGRLGVCIASNGPGVANALPGVVVEHAEGNRVLMITSCRRSGIIYPDRGGSYQYFDQVRVTEPITKWRAAVSAPARIPELLRQAFRASYRGRPGVVHLDVPEDLINGATSIDPDILTLPSRYRRTDPLVPAPEQLEAALGILSIAERPLIHAGTGVIHAAAFDALRKTAELLNAPVTTSWGGRGAFPESHRLSLPMIYVREAAQVRNEADAVIVLGSRLGETDWWGKPPHWPPHGSQKTIQVDIDEEAIGRNRPVSCAVVSDVRVFLERLNEKVAQSGTATRSSWVENLEERKRRARLGLEKRLARSSSFVNSAQAASTCSFALENDAIMVVDGGNTAVWGSFYHRFTSVNSFLSTFKFGMLGAGVGQALGAKTAFPHRQVCCLIGDGAMGFQLQEIETAVRNNLAVVYVVLCDRQWGMVKMSQQFALKPLKTIAKRSLSEEETINTELRETSFDVVAKGMGARGARVSCASELEKALARAFAEKVCTVIHVDVDPVSHLWAPGLKSFKAMHLEPK